MIPKKDITGNVYGRLTVVSFHGYEKKKNSKYRESLWLCKCNCGNTKLISTSSITQGTLSCGCFKKDNLLELHKNQIGVARTDEVKEKLRKKLIGRSPSNKGVKRNEPAWNKLPTKTVNCECGCGISFEVRMTSKQKYHKGHYLKLISSGGNPCSKQEVKDKISKTLTETYKAHPEILDKISKTLIETYKNKPEILENRKPSGINQYSGEYTSIEKLIADALTLINIDFRHNIKIGRYFPDFVVFENVIIECDGEYWHKDKESDYKRDSYLMDKGYYIFRLAGKRIIKDPIKCIISVVETLVNLGHIHTVGYHVDNIKDYYKLIKT